MTASLDKKVAEVGDQLQLVVRITGVKSNLLRPRLPELEGFDSFFRGRANQFTFVNGKSESNTTFNYVLVPKRPGRFTIPSFEVQVDEKVFRTDPVGVQVTGSAQSSPAPVSASPQQSRSQVSGASGGSYPAVAVPRQTSQAPAVSAPIQRTVTPGTDRDIFLSVTADRAEVYPNEQVLLTYAVYTRFSTRAEQFEKDPNLGGLWVEEIPIEKNYQPEKVTIGGLQYLKADIRRLAVFPTSPGILEIDPGVFRVTVKKENRQSSVFDDFFDDNFFGSSVFAKRETKLLTAEPLKLTVRPLPEQDKPADFSGMVGEFRMTTQVDKRSVKQNEPILMVLTIEGSGNMEMVARPKIDEMKDIKFYDTDTQNQFIKDRAGVRGRKIFEITFIPTEAGDLEIPSLEFDYFDPRKGIYQVLKSQTYQIKVSPAPFQQLSQISEEGGELKKTLKSERSDIYYIEENFNPARRKIPFASLLPVLFLGTVALSFFAVVLWVKRAYEERLDSNLAVKRSLFAKRDLQRGMKKLAKLCRAKTPEKRREYYDYASKLLNAYIAGKFNLSAQGLTMQEIEEKLLEKGCESDRLGRVEKFYQLCDEVRFTSAEVPEARPEDFRHLAEEICAFLEKR